jgi:outer membrane protein OmpA-like peptidoglycan-associated protein
MIPRAFAIVAALALAGVWPASPAQAQDKPGCTDPPLFTRVSGFNLTDCQQKEFDAYTFVDPATKKEVSVEGHFYRYDYNVQKGLRDQKSTLQVARNYTNAIAKIGGVFLMRPSGENYTYMKVTKDGKEIWACIDQDSWGGNTYYLFIVEKDVMTQEVVADAKFMADGISSTGHVAVYGVYFETDKAEIKPESEPALAEMAKLLKGNPALNVFIVGHTDSTGTVEHNLKLSQDRATAVVTLLVSKHGIAASRLKAYGVGSLAPVAPNKTDEGRAKNRRVELVER